jgi:rRNA maturation RNase YbeY
MRIWIQNRQKKYGMNRRKVLQWAREILSAQNYQDAELGLLFVNDRQIRTYNAKYRGKDKPTDVLSFPMLEGIGGGLHPQFLGDVMISLETARKEAVLFGRKESEQVLVLLIHGVLHLIGYDHEREEKEARRMERRERLLFKRLIESSKN